MNFKHMFKSRSHKEALTMLPLLRRESTNLYKEINEDLLKGIQPLDKFKRLSEIWDEIEKYQEFLHRK